MRAVPKAANASAFQRYAWLWQLLFIAAHGPLAMLIRKGSPYATWHARAVLVVGIIVALRKRSFAGVACVVAYITGAEVFWRMRKAEVPWEFGKYAVVLILLVSLLRNARPRRTWMPLAYFLLLIPSSILTFYGLDAAGARDQISFNLSGPLAVAVCITFFHSLRFSKDELRWIYASYIGPVLAIGWSAATLLSQFQPDEFGNDSNALASGGYGPNQVAAVLGLGILLTFFWLVLGAGNTFASGALGLLILFLFRQCVITFSRGGIYMAVGGMLAAGFYLARDRRTRMRLATGALLILPIVIFVVWPRLEAMTSGVIAERFSDTQLTGRDKLIRADLESWAESPVLGVGPGLGNENRLKYSKAAAAHTEYTRLLAEHGLLGLAALILTGWMALSIFRSAPTRLDKALAAGLLAFALLSMVVDGMRLVAVAFTFGMAAAHLVRPRRAAPAASAPPARVVRSVVSRA